MTYRHLGLYNPQTKQNPIFLGPIMIHTQKDGRNFMNFAHCLEKHYLLNKSNYPASIHSIKKVITDDDSGLRNAFKLVFHRAEFMLCANHLRKDIITEMGQFDMTIIQKEKLLLDIFGEKGSRLKSLICSKNPEEYNDRVKNLAIEWDNLKSKKNPKRSFKDYFFKNKYDKILETVIKPNMNNFNVLTEDQVEQYFTTNDVESKNHDIKSYKDKRTMKYTFSKMAHMFQEMIQGEQNQAIMAMRGSGDYILSVEYKKYEINPMVWCQLTNHQQQSKINQFKKAYIENNANKNNITEYYKKKALERDIEKQIQRNGNIRI